jgi:hypothetical protein
MHYRFATQDDCKLERSYFVPHSGRRIKSQCVLDAFVSSTMVSDKYTKAGTSDNCQNINNDPSKAKRKRKRTLISNDSVKLCAQRCAAH